MRRIFSSRANYQSKVFVAFALLGSTLGFGQNLVINPSFESVNVGSLQCSWYTTIAQFNNAINNWTLPTGGSTDIFNTALATSCYCSPFSTHTSNPGQQAPRTGNGYCNIVTYGNGGCTPWREYLQGQLSSAMVVGQSYEVEFWVTLADKMAVGTNNIGVKFSTNPYTTTNTCPYYTTPELNYTGPIILDKTNWVQILFTYTPTVAGLDNFIIGNFYNDPATTTAAASGVTSGTTIRYYVDDVRIEPVVLLPIELSAFTASCSNDRVELNWTTQSEQNNDYFTLEKSANSIDFYELGQVGGAGNSSTETHYRFVDDNSENTINYYRLKQTDFDGNSTYSRIVVAQCEGAVKIFPNPSSGDLYVTIFDPAEGSHYVYITDMLGQVTVEEIDVNTSAETHLISSFQNFRNGIYILQVKDPSGEVIVTSKVVKN